MVFRRLSLGPLGLVGAVVLAVACGTVGETDSSSAMVAGSGAAVAGAGGGASASSGGSSGQGAGAPNVHDPLGQSPVDDGGLVNVSTDLDAVLEGGALETACTEYWGGKKDRATMLRCGKRMFFDESFGTSGVPAALVDFLVKKLPNSVGPGMAKLGMIADPRSTKSLPLGIVPTTPLSATVPAYGFSCASCHFGRLPDGRYAVGAPNHDYDYGLQNLAFALFPQLALADTGANDPDAVARVKPLLDELAATPGLKLQMMVTLIGLLGVKIPEFPAEVQHHYANWRTGTMDFLIAPLPIDDGVHTVSKISALWSIPTAEEMKASGMSHAMLGWGGPVHSVMNFLKEFVSFGGGVPAAWPEEKLAPLVAYIETLRAPANPTPPASVEVEAGQALFETAGCTTCHGGPAGGGTKTYTFEEIGTDSELAKWLDPKLSGKACCGATLEPGETLSHGVKSPRLVGAWAMSRFLHNGSVSTLEELFCVNGPRGAVTEPAYRDGGHAFTCDGLTPSEKQSLIAYLRAR